jgi:DNA-binding transcriptional LysR family regulator
LRRELFVLAVPASWATGIDEPTDLASTVELPWIWLPRSISPDYHDQVVACCRAADFAPDARHTARSITSQLAMVACGLGVALVPESATHSSTGTGGEGVRLLRLGQSTAIDLAVVWRRGPSPLVDGFIHSARAAIGG